MYKDIYITDNLQELELKIKSKDKLIIRWNASTHYEKKEEINLIKYIDDRSNDYREKYLRIIDEILNYKFKENFIHDYIDINQKMDFKNFEILQKDNIHKSKYINDLLRLLALEDILKKLKIKRIFLRINNINVKRVIKDFALKNKIRLFIIKDNSYIRKLIIYKLMNTNIAHILKSIIWLIRQFLISQKLKCKEEIQYENIKNVFTTYLGNNLIKNLDSFSENDTYWGELPSKLNIYKISSLFVHIYIQGIAPFRARETINLLNKKNKLQKHLILDSLLNFKIFSHMILNFYKVVVKSFFLNFEIINRKSFFNYFIFFEKDLKNDLLGISLIRNIYFTFLFRELHNSLNSQSKFFYILENHPWENAVLKIRRSMNFRNTYGFIHNPIRYWDLRYLFNFKKFSNNTIISNIPDYLLVGDKVSEKYLLNYDTLKSKIIKIESLRFLDLNLIYRNKERKNLKKIKKILIFTDYNFEFAKFQIDLLLSTNFYKNNNQKIKLIIKEHPARYGKINSCANPNIEVTNANMSDLINHHDIFIAPFTSAVAIYLYYSSKPFILTRYYSGLEPSIFRDFKNVSSVSNAKELDLIFDSIINEDYLTLNMPQILDTNHKLLKWIRLVKS